MSHRIVPTIMPIFILRILEVPWFVNDCRFLANQTVVAISLFTASETLDPLERLQVGWDAVPLLQKLHASKMLEKMSR